MNGSTAQQELAAQLASVAADVASLKAGMVRLESQRAPLTTMLLVACAVGSLSVAVLALYTSPDRIRTARTEKELDESKVAIARVDDRLDQIERSTVRIDYLEIQQRERDTEIANLVASKNSTIERIDSRLDEIERTTVRIDFLEKRQAERDAEIGNLDKRLRNAGY